MYGDSDLTSIDLSSAPYMSGPIADLAAAWIEDAEVFRRYDREKDAAMLRVHLQQLMAALGRWHNQPLTLQEAARESGYTVDHLGRLVREGTVPNAGERHAPRIRRSDLPKKPGYQPEVVESAEDSIGSTKKQIARSVVDSETTGGHDEQR